MQGTRCHFVKDFRDKFNLNVSSKIERKHVLNRINKIETTNIPKTDPSQLYVGRSSIGVLVRYVGNVGSLGEY